MDLSIVGCVGCTVLCYPPLYSTLFYPELNCLCLSCLCGKHAPLEIKSEKAKSEKRKNEKSPCSFFFLLLRVSTMTITMGRLFFPDHCEENYSYNYNYCTPQPCCPLRGQSPARSSRRHSSLRSLSSQQTPSSHAPLTTASPMSKQTMTNTSTNTSTSSHTRLST